METTMLQHGVKAAGLRIPMLASMAVALGLAAAQPAQAEIKIGFQAPLTGFAATDGKSAKIAA
jgi:branched-chain amino acid transport system substrate-binding protein